MAENVYDKYFGNYTLVRNSDRKMAKYNWQKALNKNGYPCTPDGIFGSITESQTKSFQRAHNLDDDGKAGRYTKLAMFNILLDKNQLGQYDTLTNDEINGRDIMYDPDRQ